MVTIHFSFLWSWKVIPVICDYFHWNKEIRERLYHKTSPRNHLTWNFTSEDCNTKSLILAQEINYFLQLAIETFEINNTPTSYAFKAKESIHKRCGTFKTMTITYHFYKSKTKRVLCFRTINSYLSNSWKSKFALIT